MGPSNDYGQRAHRDLIATRGAGFRKEKNKKKRGSYRGGEITVSNYKCETCSKAADRAISVREP